MEYVNYNEINRIIVIGCPGSGKSYFSKKLAAFTHIPVYHLDLLYWKPNWKTTPTAEFRKSIIDVMKKKEWIIDGNYNDTLEERFKETDLIYFLDLSTEDCLENVKNRIGKARDDFPKYLKETKDPDFFEYIRNFKDNGRLSILAMIEKYQNVPVITLRNKEEMDEYLKEFELHFKN